MPMESRCYQKLHFTRNRQLSACTWEWEWPKRPDSAFSIRGGGWWFHHLLRHLSPPLIILIFLIYLQMILCSVPWVEIRPSDAISLSRDTVLHSSKNKTKLAGISFFFWRNYSPRSIRRTPPRFYECFFACHYGYVPIGVIGLVTPSSTRDEESITNYSCFSLGWGLLLATGIGTRYKEHRFYVSFKGREQSKATCSGLQANVTVRGIEPTTFRSWVKDLRPRHPSEKFLQIPANFEIISQQIWDWNYTSVKKKFKETHSKEHNTSRFISKT
jgi:hypothetical protein